MNRKAIGIFDSGVGGLTVFEEIRKELPNENVIYLGDTKNFPYGNKTKEEIIEFATKNTEMLIKMGAKIIVIACGTATSQAIDVLKQKLEEARSKQAMLVARSRMADAKSQMAKTLGGMDSKSAFAKMDKMEEKISQKESQADAFSEVSGIQESESDPFAQMDKENSINAELEKLKNEMNNNN